MNVSTPLYHELVWKSSLKGQYDAITLRVLFLVHVDLAINHGHDAIPEL
jgi:hypothetical protein